MHTARDLTASRWFRVVSVLALIWTLLGVLSFVMDPLTSEAALAEMSEDQRRLFESRPTWLFVVYVGGAGVRGLAGPRRDPVQLRPLRPRRSWPARSGRDRDTLVTCAPTPSQSEVT